MTDVPEDIREKTKRAYRYERDAEAKACVAAASEAWREAFAHPRHGHDAAYRAGPPVLRPKEKMHERYH